MKILFLKNIDNTRYKRAEYKCYCGNIFITSKHYIKSGHTRSCGCYHKKQVAKAQYKDGRTGTRLWCIYNNMIQRCNNNKYIRFKDYGGRGIKIYKKWQNFEAFKKWSLNNGYESHLTIDRKNNDKGYYPSNCRWTTNKIQNTNKRIKANKTGYEGVSYNTNKKRFSVYFQTTYMGTFDSVEEAATLYQLLKFKK